VAKAHLDAGTERWDAFIQVDNQIHMALARMARNPVYESVMQTVYDNIHRYFDRFLPRQEDILKENYQDLCEVIKAVEEKEASKASLLVQGHVYKFNRLMEKRARKERGRPKKGEGVL
jgi:GntR family transcriptional repressor for pyruvate dehydrogenase complex